MKVYVTDADAGFNKLWTPKYMLFPNDVTFNDLYDSILDVYTKEYNKNNPNDNGDPVEDWFYRGIIFERSEGDCDLMATIYNDYIE